MIVDDSLLSLFYALLTIYVVLRSISLIKRFFTWS